MLDVKRLNIFREVVTQGSFSAAADALDYSQSAVSQAIQTLEGEAGVALIERSRGGVRPTAVGAALTGHIGGILAQLQAAEDEIAAIVAGRGGHLRTASFPTAGATLMPQAIAAFRGSHPGVEVSLAEGEPEEIAPRLRAGEFDLALLFEFEGVGERLTTGLRRFELFDDPLHLALPATHRLAAREKPPRLEDLREESWIQTSAASPCARHVVRSCIAAGFEPRVSFESDDYLTVQGLVAAGVGVALIPQTALSTVREDIVVRPLAPRSPVRKVFAAIPRTAGATAAVATMLDVLRRAGRAQSPNPEPPPGRRTGGDSVIGSGLDQIGRQADPVAGAADPDTPSG